MWEKKKIFSCSQELVFWSSFSAEFRQPDRDHLGDRNAGQCLRGQRVAFAEHLPGGQGGRAGWETARLVARVSRVPGRTGGPWRRSSARCRPASSVTALTPSLTASPLCRPCCRAHPEGDLSPRRPTPGTGISKCSQESSLSFIRCHLPLLCPSAATPSILHFSCFYLSASHSKSPFIPFLRSHSSEVLPVIVPAQKLPPYARKLTCYKLICIPTCFPFECWFPVAANDLIQHPCSPVVGFLWSIAWSRDSGCPRIT